MRKKNRNIIEGQGITYNYLHYDEDGKVDSAQLALDHVDLDVEAGQFIAILGHNGSGKSTLAKQINALLLPGEGTLYVDGNDTRDESKLWEIRQCAGMVFQNPDNQIIASVVEEDVGFGPENMGVPTKQIWERAERALRAVDMWKYRGASPNRLSGGQKQRVAIARALVNHPRILLADEPTGALDSRSGAQVMDLFEELNAEGVTVLMITHDNGIAHRARRMVEIRDGELGHLEDNRIG